MRVPLPAAKRRVRIEIIPLIDIVFFLLATFVMVSLSMVKNQGISVNLPTASTGSPQEAGEIIAITVNEQGDIYLDKDLVSFEQMSARLKGLKISDPDLKVLINGDAKAHFGKAIGILDEVRRLGIGKVSIRTKGEAAR
ncbi:MAG: biopolymer transporter ExbD [Candidatus Omnitrophica bacterium]|nr:biopolymer transporter ExbD [Candidatus Omnitrophota bacterium]